MHLHLDSQEYTAFVTPHGVYQWTVLPMGVKNGPALFQRMISWVLRDLTQVLVYIDDVLVGTPEPRSVEIIPDQEKSRLVEFLSRSAKNPSDQNMKKLDDFLSNCDKQMLDILDLHFIHVCGALDTFRKHMLFVKGIKMHLFMITIKFCGHILSGGQRRAAPSKLEAIRKWTPDVMTRVTHLKAFLGLAQYYAIYMKDFARIAVPLRRQLKNRDFDDTRINWDAEMRYSIKNIKILLL